MSIKIIKKPVFRLGNANMENMDNDKFARPGERGLDNAKWGVTSKIQIVDILPTSMDAPEDSVYDKLFEAHYETAS